MAVGINGTITFSYEPYAGAGTPSYVRQYPYYSSMIQSANSPIEYTVRWESSGITEADEPQAANYSGTPLTGTGDVVNVLFDIYISNDRDAGSSYTTDWHLLTTVRKSRDIRNIEAGPPVTGGQGTSVATDHRFTVDISEIIRDELSYSLVPLGKGTWAQWQWGGLNGGKVRQANVSVPIWQNTWVQSTNGTYTWVRVRARTEILDADSIIQEATASGSFKSSYSSIIVLNTAPQWDSNKSDINATPYTFGHRGWGTSAQYARIMQSWTPNYTYTSSTTHGRKVMIKDMRPCEQTEILQWYQSDINNIGIWYLAGNNPEGRAYDSNNASDLTKDAYLEVTCYDKNWAIVNDTNGERKARLFDWTNNLPLKLPIAVDATGGGGTAMNITDAYPRSTRRVVAQNISVGFINANIIHPDSTVQHTWEYGGTTWTREVISNGTASDQSALFINDDVEYYRIGMSIKSTEQGAGQGVVKGTMTEFRWYRVDRSKMEIQAEAGGTTDASSCMYGGIYYTELRSDYGTNLKKIRCKGLYWGQTPRAFIRFHWLNAAGGIDSYTVKGPQTKTYLVNKETILRNEGNRWNVGWGKNPATAMIPGTTSGIPPYPAANSASAGPSSPFFSDTMKGGDNHKGGREVVGVDADRMGTATTLPLYPQKAEWLKQLALSPNVWIETDTMFSGPEQPYFNKIMMSSVSNITRGANMDGRTPTNSVYTPVIITNEEVNTVDETTGYTTITFEYTYGHQVITQRN